MLDVSYHMPSYQETESIPSGVDVDRGVFTLEHIVVICTLLPMDKQANYWKV